VFVGRRRSEAALLAMAFDYESATHHRRAPELHKGRGLLLVVTPVEANPELGRQVSPVRLGRFHR